MKQRELGLPVDEPPGPRGEVTHDSGWYCPIPGRQLPPIEWFEVPPHLRDGYDGK